MLNSDSGEINCGGSGEDGFTLLETLIVLTIIGLIMGLVGPRVLHVFGDAKVKTAQIQISSLNAAVDLFYLDAGRYPTVDEGLDALFNRPQGAGIWNGPYAKGLVVPLDPWGHPYQYRLPGKDGPYEISTFGPDGDVHSSIASGS